MKLTIRAPLFAALSATFLLATASPSDAQVGPVGPANPATHMARGRGTVATSDLVPKQFTFSVNAWPNGQVGGYVLIREPVTQGFFYVHLTSMMFLGDALAVAGPITMSVNTPFPVGATAFFVVNDNGNGTPVPDDLALGVAPLSLGSLTIQEIIGMVGPPPPQVIFPILTGDIRIF